MTPSRGSPPRPIRPDDLSRLEAVTEVVLDASTGVVAFAVGWPDLETDKNRSRLWLADGQGVRQLTDGHCDTKMRFAPDGSRLAFLRAEPDAKAQPMVLDLENGDAQTMPGFAMDGATALEWVGNDTLAVLAAARPAEQVDATDDELARRPRIIRGLDYRFNGRGWVHDRRVGVHLVDVASGTRRPLALPGADAIDHRAIAPSPDGQSILVVAASDADADLTGGNRVWWLRVDGSAARCLTPSGCSWGWVGWALDGRPLAIGSTSVTRVAFSRPHLLSLDGETPPRVIGPHDVNAMALLGSGVAVPVDGALLCAGHRGGAVCIDRYDLGDGSVTTVAGGRLAVVAFDGSADGRRLVAAVSTPTRPAELWEFGDGQGRVVHELNTDVLRELELVEPTTITVESADATSVEGFVYEPPRSSRSSAGKGPGLLYVHGGPMFAYGYGFFDEFQIAAAAGYVVVAGNPRGSDGYGEQWAASITGCLGTIDFDDVMALAGALIDHDDVDPGRVGIGGGSYGGFMTAWVIGHSDRFVAALVERAVTNWESFEGTSDIGGWFGRQLLGASIDGEAPNGVDALRRMSPLSHAARNRTPTLILHAEEDWRCPIEQAEQLFAAYRRHGVDVTFVRFPGENHDLTRGGSPRHRQERFAIVHDFFADHLGGHRVR